MIFQKFKLVWLIVLILLANIGFCQDSLKVHLFGEFNGEKYKIFFSDKIIEIKTPQEYAYYSFYINYTNDVNYINLKIITKSFLNIFNNKSTIKIDLRERKKYFMLYHDRRLKKPCFYDEWTDEPKGLDFFNKIGFLDDSIHSKFRHYKIYKK